MPYICNAPDKILVMSSPCNRTFAKFLVVLEGFYVSVFSLVSLYWLGSLNVGHKFLAMQ